MGILFDTVVLEWCKLFGSDEENLHWKNFVSDVEEFRKRLLDHVNINVAAWDSYWCEMKTYRNQSVAHYDEQRKKILTFPFFDIAIESACFYYEVIIAGIELLPRDLPSDLRAYSDEFANASKPYIIAAIKATGEEIYN